MESKCEIIPHSTSTMAAVANVPSLKLLEKLHELLQQIDRSRRQEIIRSQFSQEQRLVLEKWILERRGSEMPGANPVPEVHVPRKPIHRKKEGFKHSLYTQPSKGLSSKKQSMKAQLFCEDCLKQDVHRGISTHRRRARILHSAVVHVERLEMRTREVESKALAQKFRQALLEIKQEVSSEFCAQSQRAAERFCADRGSAEFEAFAQKLRAVVQAVLGRKGLDADEDLGLYFRVTTPARQWIGTTLCGPVFHLRNLWSGLKGWKLMQEARGVAAPDSPDQLADTWVRFRQAHLDLWEHVGRCRAETARRLDVLVQRNAGHRQCLLQRWQLRDRRRQAAHQRAKVLNDGRAARLEATRARVRAKTEARLQRLLACWSTRIAIRKAKVQYDRHQNMFLQRQDLNRVSKRRRHVSVAFVATPQNASSTLVLEEQQQQQ
eukprot:TRINITY_DN53464_c0_g1_i1.p1 TRINITY_DN53464_c0_g1~~TRINITY_DN53464_c0_g1_i1.p1  ORF type:complete len:435 (-),score=74.18 TRINITY_DN53464_c0_g1_i1:21-1325(-)